MKARQEILLTDLSLCAYLVVRGHQVHRVEGSVGRRQLVFLDVPPDVITSYFGGDDRVSARALLDTQRALKALVVQGL